MRVERCDYRGTASGFGLSNGFPGNSLMPKVEAVEIAQRNDCAAQGFGHIIASVEARNHFMTPFVSSEDEAP